MAKTVTNNKMRMLRAKAGVFFLLFVMVFLSAGIRPNNMDHRLKGKIELTDQADADKEKEQKEGKEECEIEFFLINQQYLSISNYNGESALAADIYGLFNPHMEIITPPPEFFL